jgi:hypothetical protein
MFQVGEQVIWKYQTGWAGGETRQADAEVVKVNRVKVRIRVWRKIVEPLGERWIEEIKNVLPSSLESYPAAEKTEDGREKHCRECSNWFLGCLNGREKWGDKAITPNERTVKLQDGSTAFVCDAFRLDPNKARKGRVVSDGSW